MYFESRLSNDFNVKAQIRSGNTALWQLRRIADHDLSQHHLKAVYTAYVCSVLEYSILVLFCSSPDLQTIAVQINNVDQ